MAYGLSNGRVTDDVTWPPKVPWGSTVGYPSDSLASCYILYSCLVFKFKYFLFCQRFLFEKAFIDNSIKKFEKHFCNHINELIGLDFIVKLAGCRALLYVRQCVLRIATRLLWRHAVGLGGVRTWSRELLRIKQSSPCLSLVLAIHASTALGITQEVEQFSRPDLEINRVDRLSRIDRSFDQTFTTVAYIALI